MKKAIAITFFTSALIGVMAAGEATAAPQPSDQSTQPVVTAPLDPISGFLQHYVAGLSFLGGETLPNCTIPTGC
ncbi:hypothetical protein ACWCW7_07560 [Nocardia tengchongensis]